MNDRLKLAGAASNKRQKSLGFYSSNAFKSAFPMCRTIADLPFLSIARGGNTVNFREFAARGMTLLGRLSAFENGGLHFNADLKQNIENGDKNYLSTLDKADAYIAAKGLSLPEEPSARAIGPAPECMMNPILKLNMNEAEIKSIIWATGYALDFSWLKVDAFDTKGRPDHLNGVSKVPGLYFLGLPWLSCRASPFIWGVWRDAAHLAEHIAKHRN